MSATEVTVDVNKDNTWWRLEYKGQCDFLEKEPTDRDKSEFKKVVDGQLRQRAIEASIPKNGRGGVQVVEMKS